MEKGITSHVDLVCPYCEVKTVGVLVWSQQSGVPRVVACGGCSKYFGMKATFRITVEHEVAALEFGNES